MTTTPDTRDAPQDAAVAQIEEYCAHLRKVHAAHAEAIYFHRYSLAALIERRTPPPPPATEDREELAYVICPVLKPWMDGDDVKPEPCRRCTVVQTNYGPGKAGCLIGAEEMADAILSKFHLVKREGV